MTVVIALTVDRGTQDRNTQDRNRDTQDGAATVSIEGHTIEWDLAISGRSGADKDDSDGPDADKDGSDGPDSDKDDSDGPDADNDGADNPGPNDAAVTDEKAVREQDSTGGNRPSPSRDRPRNHPRDDH